MFNLGSGRERSIREVVDLVFAAAAKELPVALAEERLRPPDSEVDRLCASVEKAQARLDWEPRVPFEEGLRRTIDWISESLDVYQPEVYGV